MKEYVQLVCLLLFCYGGILKAENLEIVSAGKSDYQIVLPDRSDSEETAEYLKEHGMVDIVVERKNLKETVDRVLRLLMDARLKKSA